MRVLIILKKRMEYQTLAGILNVESMLIFHFCFQMDRFGRKKTLLITEIPMIIGFSVVAVATNVEMIYAGRLLMGLGSGLVGAPARVYISEVTQPHLRGMLSAMAASCISFGILLQYTIGYFFSWTTLSAVSAIIPVGRFFFLTVCCFLKNTQFNQLLNCIHV